MNMKYGAKSHLLQMRGLKRKKYEDYKMRYVSSFTDAWIETIFIDGWEGKGWVASFTDAWIETS